MTYEKKRKHGNDVPVHTVPPTQRNEPALPDVDAHNLPGPVLSETMSSPLSETPGSSVECVCYKKKLCRVTRCGVVITALTTLGSAIGVMYLLFNGRQAN